MASHHIYLNEKDELLLKNKKKENNFNFSMYISECLTKEEMQGIESVDKLNALIETKKAQINLIQSEIDAIVIQIKTIIENNEKYQRQMKAEEEYENQKMDMERFLTNMDDSDREEYKAGLKEKKWGGYVEFAKIKLGIKKDA